MITLPGANLVVSFVISTHNRREVLLQTLSHIGDCGLGPETFEVLVVDNASGDGTAQAVAKLFPRVRLFALAENRGACAKNVAIEQARGRYVVFLDDDSYPLPGSMSRMIRHFEANPSLGAAVFTITLPDGSQECSAYPDVFIGCGTGFRRGALVLAGGLPEDFFMQAEEYDLSLRLMQGGWEVRSFEDLEVMHVKTRQARRSWRTLRLDVRNNFAVATRYFPDAWAGAFTADWMWRYWRIAKTKRQRSAFLAGLLQGMCVAIGAEHRRPVNEEVFDRFTRMSQIEQWMRQQTRRQGLWTILLVDLGKNILPYWMAARKCDLKIVAIADNRLSGTRKYRGIPIVNDSVARRLEFDAAIISNLSPIHAAIRRHQWCRLDNRPVLDVLAPPATEVPRRVIAA